MSNRTSSQSTHQPTRHDINHDELSSVSCAAECETVDCEREFVDVGCMASVFENNSD